MTLPTPPARKEIIMAPFAAVLTRLMRRPWYPGLLQWLSVLFFLPVVGYLLFGPADKDNPGNLLVWLVWWPLLCVLFLVAGRFWCGICPFSKVSDGVRRLVGLRRAVPDFLKEQGGWLILIAFILLSWLEETRGILDSPRQTAILLLSILTGAIVFSLFFQGRVWCRYVCPIGGLSQVYSRAALFKVRPREDICADCTTKDCMVPDAGYAGCPMHLSPFAMESVTQCNLCGGCVKRCQHGSLQLRYEAPAAELTAESPMAPVVLWLIPFLAGLISLLNALESGRLPLEGWLEATAYPVLIKTLLMAAALGGTWWLLRALSRLAASANPGRMSPDAWLALGARPLIPLLLLSHLGHVGAEFWQDGGHLLGPLARVLETPGLALPGLWGADWTAYANALCILLGLVLALALLGWTAVRAQGIDRTRFVLAFGTFYLLFAGWNLHATWPLMPDASQGAVVHRPQCRPAGAGPDSQARAPGHRGEGGLQRHQDLEHPRRRPGGPGGGAELAGRAGGPGALAGARRRLPGQRRPGGHQLYAGRPACRQQGDRSRHPAQEQGGHDHLPHRQTPGPARLSRGTPTGRRRRGGAYHARMSDNKGSFSLRHSL